MFSSEINIIQYNMKTTDSKSKKLNVLSNSRLMLTASAKFMTLKMYRGKSKLHDMVFHKILNLIKEVSRHQLSQIIKSNPSNLVNNVASPSSFYLLISPHALLQ